MVIDRPRVPIVVLLAGVLAACSGAAAAPSGPTGGSTSSSGTFEASPAADASGDLALTPWAAEALNLQADGRRSLDSALKLFAMALGPIPGVDVPSDPGPIGSLTSAVRVIRAHWSELGQAQQDAIERALTPPADAPSVDVGPVAGSSSVPLAQIRLTGLAAALTDPMITVVGNAVNDARTKIAAKLGDIPDLIHVVVEDTNNPTGDFALTGPTWSGSQYAGCTIIVFPVATTEAGVIANTAAHEVFHCFEAAGVPNEARWGDAPDWWVEGGAEWVGEVLGYPDLHATASNVWPRWLKRPDLPLPGRSYDAIGFFAHLQETGTDPWTAFPKIFTAVDTAPAFQASGAGGDAFMDSWASSHLRDASRGAAWDATGPSITGDAALPAPFPVSGTTETDLTVEPFTGRLYQLQVSADVLQLTVLGHARLSDGAVDLAGGALVSAAFCTKDGGCACPNGAPLPVQLPALKPDAMFAVSAADQPVQATIAGTSLDQLCKPAPSSQGQDLWVHLETVKEGHKLVLDLISCNGPYGPWNGTLTDATTNYVWPVAKMVGEKTPLFGVDTSKNVFLWGLPPDTFSIPIQPAPAGRCP